MPNKVIDLIKTSSINGPSVRFNKQVQYTVFTVQAFCLIAREPTYFLYFYFIESCCNPDLIYTIFYDLPSPHLNLKI